jgi:putative spermidine/putrescine transport system permease protein
MSETFHGTGVVSKAMLVVVVLFLLLPLAVVVPISFGQSSLMEFPPSEYSLRWYRELFDNRQWLIAAATSIKVGIIVAIISTIFATLTAMGLARYEGRGKAALQALILSPLMVPVIVTGVALYYLFSMLRLTGTITALVVAHTLLTFPYGVIVITAALERFDVRLEQASMSLGAGPFMTFFRITLPIIRSAVIVTALFSFLISFDEVVMALLLSGPETLTVPKLLWDGIRFDLTPVIAAVSTILMVLSTILVILAEILRRHTRGATSKHA